MGTPTYISVPRNSSAALHAPMHGTWPLVVGSWLILITLHATIDTSLQQSLLLILAMALQRQSSAPTRNSSSGRLLTCGQKPPLNRSRLDSLAGCLPRQALILGSLLFTTLAFQCHSASILIGASAHPSAQPRSNNNEWRSDSLRQSVFLLTLL